MLFKRKHKETKSKLITDDLVTLIADHAATAALLLNGSAFAKLSGDKFEGGDPLMLWKNRLAKDLQRLVKAMILQEREHRGEEVPLEDLISLKS